MDFEEFLEAIGEEKLKEVIKEAYYKMKPLAEPIHNKALNLYNQYMCIGGMPIAIKEYKEKGKEIIKFNDEIEDIILTSYLADMTKYTQNMESIRNSKIYNSIPAQLGKENKKFKYSLVEKSARAREYESSMDWLIASNMIIKCNGIQNPKSPLKAYIEDNFKVYLSDMGLLRKLAKISTQEILLDKNMIYKGAMTENYVAQISKPKELEKAFETIEENYSIKITQYNQEFYKQGFIDGVNLMINCLKM